MGRRRLVFAAGCALFLAWEVWAVGWAEFGVVASRSDRPPVWWGELNSETSVEQQFPEVSPSMNRIVIHARPHGARVSGDLVAEYWEAWVWENAPRSRGPAFRTVIPASTMTTSTRIVVTVPVREDLRVRPILRVVAPGSPPTEGYDLLVHVDDAYPGGWLSVGGREQWGDLVFETGSARGTVWRNSESYVRRLVPRPSRARFLMGLLFVVLNAALVALAYYAIFEGWMAARRPATGSSVPAPGVSAPARFRVPAALAWTIMAILLVASVLTMPDLDWGRGPAPGTIDLLERFPEAGKQAEGRGLHDAFSFDRVVIDGVGRRVLFAHPPSKVTWRLRLPTPARLETAFAIRPDAWTLKGDGVVFKIEVWEAGRSRTLVEQWVDPYDRPADRRWFPVSVDVSPWGGRDIDIVFSTQPGFNAVHDAAVWAEPVIIPR